MRMRTHVMSENYTALASKILELSCDKTVIYVPNGGTGEME